MTAYQEPSTSIYHYEIFNQSDRPIVGVQIGNDFTTGQCGLSAFPEGWTVDNGIPPGSSTAPTGWTANAFMVEDIGKLCVTYMASESVATWDIAPGTSLDGFSVRAEVADAPYLNGYVTIIFDDGSILLCFFQ